MTTWIALLRGINVGGHHRVPMAELRAGLTDAGFGDVATYIQSGNVVVSSDGPAEAVAEGVATVIRERFGHEIPVVVRTAEELAAVFAANPFPELVDEPKRLHVFFCDRPLAADALDGLDHAAHLPDRAEVGPAEVYVAYAESMSASKLGTQVLDRILGTATTARNWNTVRKLADLAGVDIDDGAGDGTGGGRRHGIR